MAISAPPAGQLRAAEAMNPNRIALVVAVFSGTAVLGPMVGVSPAWITVAVISALVMVVGGCGGMEWPRRPSLG